jgi:hypothetical protein
MLDVLAASQTSALAQRLLDLTARLGARTGEDPFGNPVLVEGLVDDAGYAALLGAFGPALLDKTGSRPSARQTDGMGGEAASAIRANCWPRKSPASLRAMG